MALGCPIQDDDYKRLVDLAGSNGAYRMWQHWESIHPGEGTSRSLQVFNTTDTPVSEKADRIISQAKLVNPKFSDVKHTYIIPGTNVEVESVSEMLNRFPEFQYQGTQEKVGFADTGTAVHDLAKMIADKVDPVNIGKFADDKGIPANVLNQLHEFFDRLSARGTVLSEQVLFTENLPDGIITEKKLAGSADVVLLANDGKIELYDFKTANMTPHVRRTGSKIWNPSAPEWNRRLRRYTGQLLAYGRLIEWTTRQSVSDHFVVPIEVENAGDDPANPYSAIRVLDPESINNYGFVPFATDQMDRVFGETSRIPGLKGVRGVDESSSVYTRLTGDVTGRVDSPTDQAREVYEANRRTKGGIRGYMSGTQFTPFNDQSDVNAQLAQIVDQVVNKTFTLNKDLGFAIRNFLETGDIKFLQGFGRHSRRLANFLKPWDGRSDIKVTWLRDITGLEDKTNWISIKEGENTHLIYIGSENLNTRFGTKGLTNNSLFGKHIDKVDDIATIDQSLRNRYGDARQIEGALIAIKLKESDPDLKIGTIMVYGLKGSAYAGYGDMKQLLHTLEQVRKHPILSDKIFTTSLLEMISAPGALDYRRYRADFRDALLHHIKTRYPGGERQDSIDLLTSAATDSARRAEAFEWIRTILNENIAMGKKVDTDYETYLLSAYWLQMQNVDVSLVPVSVYSNYFSLPQNIRNPIVQFANKQMRDALTDGMRRFRDEYKADYVKTLEAFLKTRSIGGRVYDRFSGDVPRHYENLMVRKKYKVAGTGKEIEIPVMELPLEGTTQYNSLSNEEKKLVTLTNDTITKMAAVSGVSWVRGRLPLVRATSANRFFRAMREGGISEYGKLVANSMADLEEGFGVGDFNMKEGFTHSNTSIFSGQWNDPGIDRRIEMMGINEKERTINMEQYQRWTSNLESMMDVFVIQSLRTQIFDTVGPTMKAMNSIFQWWKSGLMDERLEMNTDFANWYTEYNILNRDVDSGSKANILARQISRLGTLAYVALSPTATLAALGGNELSIFSQSAANMLSKSGDFDLGTMTRAKFIIAKAVGLKKFDSSLHDKISLLMRRFRLFNEDMSSMLNGYHRTGDKYMFRSKMMFAPMNAVDWQSRGSIMIAQLLKDGSWDAYSVSPDGKLEYDESKDDKFNGRGKYDKEQSAALRKYLIEQQDIQPGDKLKWGHDDRMGDNIRGMTDYLLGGFDRETRSGMNARWWGKLLGSMKNWMPAKIDRWVMGRHTSETMGSIQFERAPNGEMIAYWKGDQMEGILTSLVTVGHYFRKAASETGNPFDGWKQLNKIQKNNVIRATSDLAMIALIMMFAHEFPDDDDDSNLDEFGALMLRRSADDLLAFYNLARLDSFIWTPISLEYVTYLYDTLFEVVTGGIPYQEVVRVIPVVRQFDSMYDRFNEE